MARTAGCSIRDLEDWAEDDLDRLEARVKREQGAHHHRCEDCHSIKTTGMTVEAADEAREELDAAEDPTCPQCGGSGDDGTGHEEGCGLCGGVGTI